MALHLEFDDLVGRFYTPLYQFAYSLTRSEADACDLTQQTFYIWAKKGGQLRDATKVKTWLLTTLHRQFLETRRRQTRFPHQDIESGLEELPCIAPVMARQVDAAQVWAALAKVDEIYQAPVALFYLEDCPYKEIAEILDVPLGTVKSRISRGVAQMQKILADDIATDQNS